MYVETLLSIEPSEAVVTFHSSARFVVNTFASKARIIAGMLFFSVVAFLTGITVIPIPKKRRHTCNDVEVIVVIEQKNLMLSRWSLESYTRIF